MNEILNNLSQISDSRFTRILIVILVALVAQQVLKGFFEVLLKIRLRSEPFSKNKRDRQKRFKTLSGITQATSSLLVWFVSILVILNILNVPLAPLLTSAGLIGAAVAFGMQSLIRDFISGIFIIYENQYRVDDYIQLEKVAGKVESISVRTTTLRDENGSLHHVPNGTIMISTNLSMGVLKAEEQLEIPAKTSIDQFKTQLAKIADIIASNPETYHYIKTGPTLKTVDKVTKDSTSITITFSTSAVHRKEAVSTIWTLIKKEAIPLA